MKLKISSHRIKELAQDLENGFNVYINPYTGESRSIPDSSIISKVEQDWQVELSEMKTQWKDHIKIESPGTFEKFEIMNKFIDSLADCDIKNELIKAQNSRKSVNYLQEIIEYSELHEDWLLFKNKGFYNYIIKHLGYNDIELE